MTQEHVIRIPIKPGMKQLVVDALEALRARQSELDDSRARRDVQQNICFVDSIEGTDWLFMYRRADNLQRAGAQFLLSRAGVDREVARVLLEATRVEAACVVDVSFSWRSKE